jgi:hypothetical protein
MVPRCRQSDGTGSWFITETRAQGTTPRPGGDSLNWLLIRPGRAPDVGRWREAEFEGVLGGRTVRLARTPGAHLEDQLFDDGGMPSLTGATPPLRHVYRSAPEGGCGVRIV